MKHSLTVKNLETILTDVKPEYRTMLKNIEVKMPSVQQASSNFYKSHSQFMNVMLDVTAITPIRSIKHTLAEIDKTRCALQEAQINMEKQKIKIKKKQRKLLKCKDDLDREMLQLKIFKSKAGLVNAQEAVQAAIRKMNFFVNQYENLLEHLGVTEITEEMYEKEEYKYHIMTCMKQALNSARPRGGMIDEGNMIYIFDLGINGAQAQLEVYNYLSAENELVKNGKEPTHEMTMKWLEACAERWANDPKVFAERRGFKLLDEESLTNRIKITYAAE